MADSPTDMTAVMDGPYTHGYFTSCGCGWTSTEQKRPGLANTELAKHRRDEHPIATIDRT
jgi:hypothetical protein